MKTMGCRASLVLCVSFLLGCEPPVSDVAWADDGVDASAPALEEERRFVETEWDTLWALGGPDDPELLNPGRLRSWEDGAVVFDHGDGRVKRFDSEGRVLWRWGGRGQGPEEFGRVRDLVVGPHGHVHVLDQGNGRIVELDGSGRRVRTVPLAGVPYADRFVPLEDGRWVLVTVDASDPLYVIDAGGGVLSRHPFPWEPFAEMSVLVKQGNVARGAVGWSYLFSPGDGWFSLQGPAGTAPRRRFVEEVPFPRLEERVVGGRRESRVVGGDRCSACSASLVDSTLWVHFGGSSDDRYRILDRYDWRSGAYLGSLRLPDRVHEAAVGRDRVHVLRSDPYPQLTALRPGVLR